MIAAMTDDIEIALKLGVALVLGALIGLEREVHKKTAGLRTHMIVCLSSALLMVLSTEVARDLDVAGDPTRIAAGVMTGIGFLGAGTIIKHGATVQGLTTAASIWTAAAVGLAVGVGYYLPATLVVLLTLLTLLVVTRVDAYLQIFKRRAHMVIYVDYRSGILNRLEAIFEEMGLDVGDFSVTKRGPRPEEMVLDVQIFDTGGRDRANIASHIMDLEGVISVEFY
jgi:putative Mg2+ transporter-C (MgtC) family protein